jgi:hypothetical protein
VEDGEGVENRGLEDKKRKTGDGWKLLEWKMEVGQKI